VLSPSPCSLSFLSVLSVALGLVASGKTTCLYKLKLNEIVTTIPTIGFNVETLRYKNVEFTIWDVGGQERIRPLWKHYMNGTNAIIYLVDSADVDRVRESADELRKCLNEDELHLADVLVLANKQDLPNAVSASRIAEIFEFTSGKMARETGWRGRWFVQQCTAVTGEGLVEGFDELGRMVSQQKTTRMY
jgi:small GTP-binding protein